MSCLEVEKVKDKAEFCNKCGARFECPTRIQNLRCLYENWCSHEVRDICLNSKAEHCEYLEEAKQNFINFRKRVDNYLKYTNSLEGID